MKIVIVGHTGFIGNNIFQNLINNKEYEILGISTNEIDLTKEKSHNTLSGILSSDCVVIMCAGIKKQLGDSIPTFDDNMSIISNFSKAVLEVHPQKIIYISSTSVYGEDVAYNERITEKISVQPKTYYGIAKYSAEKILEKVCMDNQIELLVLRPPLVYGKDDLSRGYGPTGFIYKAINGEEIILWGDGSEFREFVYVDDVGKIVNCLINNNYNGILNLVSGTSYTFNNIINLLNNIVNHKIEVVFCKRTKQKVDHRYSNENIASIIGNFKFTDLKDGLSQTYSLLKKQSYDNK